MNIRLFKYIVFFITTVPFILTSCGLADEKQLDDAAGLVFEHPDSAYTIIRNIDYNGLGEDSLRAKYILTRALANEKVGRSLITDTLLDEATDYFLNAGDTARWVLASQLLSGYDFIKGNTAEALARLENMLTIIKNSELIWDIRINALQVSHLCGDYKNSYRHADWLLSHTDVPEQILKFGVVKGGSLYYQGCPHAALAILDSIIGTGVVQKSGPEAAREFYHEYSEILDGAGHSSMAISIIDSLYRDEPQKNNVDRFYRFMTLARFCANAGRITEAQQMLDSINIDGTRSVFEIYSSAAMFKAAMQFKETGIFPSVLMHEVSKNLENTYMLAQYDSRTAMESVIELSEDKYELKLQRQRLWLLVLGVSLLLIVVCITVYFILDHHRKHLMEAEERAETLERMLKEVEMTNNAASVSDSEKLRAVLLRQLGIFKIFACTPTSQSRDALKKISAVGNNGTSIESLVDWPQFYSMIDNLYDGFHSKLMSAYPGAFNEKEQQIIVLLKAEFSTKEIGVLTEQSSATIYTRKSVIRKKVGSPENGDLIATIEDNIRHA